MQIAIALVQMAIAPSQPELNLKRMEAFVAEAAGKGAQLVVFPEDAVTGPLSGQLGFIDSAPAYLARFQALAVRYAVDIVPGTWTVREGALLHNTAHYIDKHGVVLGIYRKINLWATEKRSIAPGKAVSVFPTAYGKVGLVICWDISFPPLFTEMNRRGVELVVSPTYWSFPPPAVRKGEEDDEILLIDSLCTARAFENNIVFAYCNAAGELQAEGVHAVLSGRSQVTHPHDKVLCQAEGNDEELLLVHAKLERAPLPGQA